MIGEAFGRRRRRRRLAMVAVASMLGVSRRAVSRYEQGRVYAVLARAKVRLDRLNRKWTEEDYDNATNGKEPTWPEHVGGQTFAHDPDVGRRARVRSLESRRARSRDLRAGRMERSP